ncbi:hypothetical protein TRAPUB_7426 [Trametes pubescens]|uniref:F-box domain-containing protein n=1 Tax=Trametes pubescens TaxID=154538 RepID=A0A1M2V3F2_TRAPU|nr:hypothetical protein TRAPUB_7426 [Trametes pubescens]
MSLTCKRLYYSIEDLYACGYLHQDNMPISGKYTVTDDPCHFGLEMDFFPALESVTFGIAAGGVPWYAIKKCLEHPTVTSISIGQNSTWMCAPPPIPSDIPPHVYGLTKLSYTPSQWRETGSVERRTDLRPTYALESSYLRALVLTMSHTAESLTLPAETAPLSEMANMDWPRLHTLSLVGRYTHPDQCRIVPLLLLRMPNLRSLSIQVMECEGMWRPPLLKQLPETGFRLRSLTVSYPNPEDPIFSYVGDDLTSLSLRDSPRHYFQSRYVYRALPAIYPILSASECLAILKRISAPRLLFLELVYQTDAAEDELLQYLPHAFPLLEELELHRYKVHRKDTVPYLHIARTLTAVKYLRALYLNLDITGSPMCPSWIQDGLDNKCADRRDEWGLEIVDVLQAAELGRFEYVAVLLHSRSAGYCAMYRPSWWRDRRVDYDSPYTMYAVRSPSGRANADRLHRDSDAFVLGRRPGFSR